MNKRLIRNNCSKYLKPYFRNIVNTLNYSNATNRNEHAFQLLFVPLESIIPRPFAVLFFVLHLASRVFRVIAEQMEIVVKCCQQNSCDKNIIAVI